VGGKETEAERTDEKTEALRSQQREGSRQAITKKIGIQHEKSQIVVKYYSRKRDNGASETEGIFFVKLGKVNK